MLEAVSGTIVLSDTMDRIRMIRTLYFDAHRQHDISIMKTPTDVKLLLVTGSSGVTCKVCQAVRHCTFEDPTAEHTRPPSVSRDADISAQ